MVDIWDQGSDLDINDDDGDDPFSPSQGNKNQLKNLFADKQVNPQSNQSLKYQGQKKPNAEPVKPGASDLKLSGPVIVEAFLFDKPTSKYKPLGKAGLILTPSKSDSGPEILVLYRSKEQTLATLPITPDNFRFNAQSDLHSSFIDSRGLTWTIKFESELIAEKFLMNLALARFRSSRSVVMQTLGPQIQTQDTTQTLAIEDNGEFEISSWGLDEGLKSISGPIQFGAKQTFQIATTQWTQNLKGIKTGASLLMVLPKESFMSDLQDEYHLYKFLMLKLKLLKKVQSNSKEPTRNSDDPKKRQEDSSSNIPEPSKSIANDTKIIANETNDVANTKNRLDRMKARLGQPIMLVSKAEERAEEESIPEAKKNDVITNNQDPNPQEEKKEILPTRPVVPDRKPIRRSVNLDSDNLVHMIFSEQRLQNADSRMSIKRLEDKLEDILAAVNKINHFEDKEILKEKNSTKSIESKIVKCVAGTQTDDEVLTDADKNFQDFKKVGEKLTEENEALQMELQKSREEVNRLHKELKRSDETCIKNVKKIVNRAFKGLKQEMGEENDAILKQMGFHLKTVTDQLLENRELN